MREKGKGRRTFNRRALRAWAGVKPMSANIDTCSADGPFSPAPALDVLSSGASMSSSPPKTPFVSWLPQRRGGG